MNATQQNTQNTPNECCVCMAQESDDLPALRDADTNTLLSLTDLPEQSCDSLHIRGNTRRILLFRSSCQDHAICNACLHHMATSFGNNHFIGPNHPLLPCPYPFGDCLTPSTGLPNYFPHATVERLLTPDEQSLYQAHAQRYQFPGFELVLCPRPSRFGTTCGAGILVSLDDIRTTENGRLIIQCDQSSQCLRQTCYHCKGLVHRTRDFCDFCLTSIENTNPKVYNHYFHRINKRAGDGQSNLYRNEELTEEIVLQQIRDIISADRLEIRCTECLTYMFKTELCNTLEHCGIERCYSCGRSGTTTRKIGDHWDSNGYKGCPRFDYSGFWNIIAGCKFRCLEGKCYGSDIGDCTNADHVQGIENMIDTRKRAHIYHAIKSLLPDLRQKTLDTLWLIDDNTRRYLPTYWANDYRTYVPDTLKQTIEHAQQITDNDSTAYKLAQTILDKVGNLALQFIPIKYPDLPTAPPKKTTLKQYEMLFERFKIKYVKPPQTRKKISKPAHNYPQLSN